jgi:hypothetical protein
MAGSDHFGGDVVMTLLYHLTLGVMIAGGGVRLYRITTAWWRR